MQRSRLRRVLLVAQAALSVVLLVGAGLFVRSLMNVRNVRLGYDADRIAWVGLNMRGVKLDTTQNIQLRDQLLATSRTLPGVYGPGSVEFDLMLAKNFRFKERWRFQFRWEMFNFTNTPRFSQPSQTVGSTDFGWVTSAGARRIMQFGLKLYW